MLGRPFNDDDDNDDGGVVVVVKRKGSYVCFGLIPKGLFTFFGFFGSAEFSPWKTLSEFTELRKYTQRSLRVFL